MSSAPKQKGSRAYKEGYKVGSRKSPAFPNLFTKSGRRLAKVRFDTLAKRYLPQNVDKAFGDQFMKGLKAGAKEYYEKKKKE